MAISTNLDVTRGFVKTRHGHIEYREAGAGEPLVILHSTPNNSAQYQELFPYLSDRYRVIAPTTLGYGDSDRPPYPYTTVREFSESLLWFLDGLRLERIQLIGSKTSTDSAFKRSGSCPSSARRPPVSCDRGSSSTSFPAPTASRHAPIWPSSGCDP